MSVLLRSFHFLARIAFFGGTDQVCPIYEVPLSIHAGGKTQKDIIAINQLIYNIIFL